MKDAEITERANCHEEQAERIANALGAAEMLNGPVIDAARVIASCLPDTTKQCDIARMALTGYVERVPLADTPRAAWDRAFAKAIALAADVAEKEFVRYHNAYHNPASVIRALRGAYEPPAGEKTTCVGP